MRRWLAVMATLLAGSAWAAPKRIEFTDVERQTREFVGDGCGGRSEHAFIF